LEHGGLALANGVAVGVESLIGLTILHLRWRGVDARRILIDAGKAALAAAIMGIVIAAIDALFSPSRLILLLGGAALGGLVYFATALLLGIEEIRTMPRTVISTVLKK
jgi:peptidoglycan biosynthesis protein MviN/MurJ (putative lipid II flippase)